MSWVDASSWPRIEIWLNSFFAYLDRPIFGAGLGGFDWAYAPHRADHWQVMPTADTVLSSLSIHAGAAHNDFLQIMVELGLIGALITGWFLYRVLAGNRTRASYAVWCVLFIALIEFPLQNAATALLLAVALGLASRKDASPSVS